MLLAIDIGNTNIKLALFKGRRIFKSWRLITNKSHTANQSEKILRRLFSLAKVRPSEIEAILVCSVVPKLTSVFKKALFSFFRVRPLILGKDIISPIRNLYRRPEQVGQDRLANAVAAFCRYGGPVIVVDFGTALTFDLVSAKGSYLGGIIVPGMELSLKALTRCADLLPKIGLSKPRVFLGRETISSMKSGIVYGYSFLVEGILQQLKKELQKRPQLVTQTRAGAKVLRKTLKQNPLVIATGGEARLMFQYCRTFNKIDENLTLEGLRISYQKEKARKKTKNNEKRLN